MTDGFRIVDKNFESSKRALHSYTTGFIISIILTVIPYVIVTREIFGKESMLVGVLVFGVLQLFTQIIFFLNLERRSRPHWNMIIFFFTIIIVAFLVVGTLWIMYHLNYNMMGASPFNSNEGYIPQ